MTSLPAFEAIRRRRAVRRISSRRVREQVLYELLELAALAPSGYNLQPWHFILVQDKELKGLLHHVALGQRQVLEAPATVVFVADPYAWKKDYPRILKDSVASGVISKQYAEYSKKNVTTSFSLGPFGILGFIKRISLPLKRTKKPTAHLFTSKTELDYYARSQTMLAASTFMIAASSVGLATAPLEGFDEDRLKRLLSIPTRLSVPLIVPIGYPVDEEEDLSYARIPLKEKLSLDLFPNKLATIQRERER